MREQEKIPDSGNRDAADILAAAVKAAGPGKEEKPQKRKEKVQERKEKGQDPAKEVLIRQILEEFMA